MDGLKHLHDTNEGHNRLINAYVYTTRIMLLHMKVM